MFGKKAAKEQQKLAQQQQTQANAYMQQAAAPTPLQSAEDKANLKFIDWENREGEFKGKPLDITEAPGLNPYLDLFRASTAANEGTSGGQGLITMGAEGSHPELANIVRQNRADRQKQVAGGALADALRQRSAQAHGYVLPSSSLSQSRTMGLAGLSSGNASNAWQRYLEQQRSAGFLNSNLFNQIMAGAGAAASGGLSEGGRFNR